MGLDGENDVALSMVSDNTAKITSAVNSLPQLLEKKRLIDMHTSVATSKLILNLFSYYCSTSLTKLTVVNDKACTHEQRVFT